MDKYELEDSTGYLIYLINQKMYSYLKEHFEAEGVNVVEAWILLEVLNGVETVSELKKSLKADMALIQRGCDRLEKEGWLKRTVHQYDKRIKTLSLTESGRKLRSRLSQYSKEVNKLAFEGMDPKERSVLHKILLNVYKGSFFESYKVSNRQI